MSLAQEGSTVYQQRAQATRSRSARPSTAQKAAFAKTMRRNGNDALSALECRLLAAHPHLTQSQRAEYAKLAEGRA
jgi:hypothetical protein